MQMPDGNNLNYINFGQPAQSQRPEKQKPHFLPRFSPKKKKGVQKRPQPYVKPVQNSKRPQRMEDSTVEILTGQAPIVISPKNCSIFKPGGCAVYDRDEPQKSSSWHQVIIHHNRRFSRQQIIDAFFRLLPDLDFYPIAYRNGQMTDSFFLRCCGAAVRKLMSMNLRLEVEENQIADLTLKMRIGTHRVGQIAQFEVIGRALEERLQNREEESKLCLSSFDSHTFFGELIISLGNTKCFETICSKLNGNDEVRNRISTLALSNNKIKSLVAIKFLANFYNLKCLDLRFNEIESVDELVHLKDLKINELMLHGNRVIEAPNFLPSLKEALPNLKAIDGFSLIETRVVKPPREFPTREPPQTKNYARMIRSTMKNGNDNLDNFREGHLIRPSDINPHTARLFESSYKNKSSQWWHEVNIQHQNKVHKDEILRALFSYLDPYDFYPCYYKELANHDTFYVHNCFDALQTLVNMNLLFKCLGKESGRPEGTPFHIFLKMEACEYKDFQIIYTEKIRYALCDLFNSSTSTLNLSEFRNHMEFGSIVVPLSSTKTMTDTLFYASKLFAQTTHLNMQKNRIKSCKGFSNLNNFIKLKSLDLRNNLIDSIDDLQGFPTLDLVELWLDQNPICSKYNESGSSEFIQDIRRIFTKLERLDGIEIPKTHNNIPMRNFLCDPDAYLLAESFVKQFFTTYDSFARNDLKQLYAEESSLFSMSIYFDAGKLTNKSIQSRVQVYRNNCRNILKLTNFQHGSKDVIKGSDRIGRFFSVMPKTEHDFQSFKIDVPVHLRSMTVIIVSGVLKECANSLLEDEMLMSFTRTFVLRPYSKKQGILKNSYEYKIFNEQLHLQNVSALQSDNAFKGKILDENELEEKNRDLIPTEFEDHQANLMIFKELTELNHSWCIKLMKESSYNLKVALTIFNTLLESKKIPLTDFEFKSLAEF